VPADDRAEIQTWARARRIVLDAPDVADRPDAE
jgi:hypothetical protein